ncbi:26s proteasome non-atpase regulatory subunit 8 [Anaeramoeba flamelloides]|uniref:26s proteasome non-atpase regulatory subunit n=1 Tax=Anaeramoeba flamelloides TaxID=1746091 RepID=A0AAV8A6A9_9EUKA|nr:26s proteasome non-atpase regulatory subunit [Anaeramoeba flamelloides]KAJ6243564.1 26s proteasome non-atpase regulatory subunit 8 [Anaeramoeba flamelloides]
MEEQLFKLSKEFKFQVEQKQPDSIACKKLLTKLKIAMAEEGILFPGTDFPLDPKNIIFAREVLELAVIMSVKLEDMDLFERQISQVKPYYFDYGNEIKKSENELLILGMHLLYLLSLNRIGEFHTELELIEFESRSNPFIKFNLQVEELLLDGNYLGIQTICEKPPSDLYSVFVSRLKLSIRELILDCADKSYKSLDLKTAKEFFMMESIEEVKEIAKKNNWPIENDKIIFENLDEDEEKIPTNKVIREILDYAKELEKII